jgi:aryl-alcohol dehydrogenase-like predicted oxidoreductase
MNYRTFGRTGAEISEVGLGTWQLGSSDWGVVEEADALAILRKSVADGVNFFDTADIYGHGTSEKVIGKFLRETGAEVHVATKLCRADVSRAGGEWPSRYTLQMARNAVEASCRNLGVGALFLEQWHCPPIEWMRDGEIFEHLEALKKEGLIQNWGVSVETVEEALICMEHPGCASLQVIYNVFRQKLTDELLPLAAEKGVGILARVPLASGLLSGRFKHGQEFPKGDHRNYNADGEAFNVGETFAGLPFEKGVDLTEKIRTILEPTDDVSMAQVALRWILDHEEVSAAIPGATKVWQAASNAAASDLASLSADVHEQLHRLYETEIKPDIRGRY